MVSQDQQSKKLAAAEFVREIVRDFDLTVRLELSEDEDGPEDDGEEGNQVIVGNEEENLDLPMPAEFKVKRDVLRKSSKFFSRLLTGGFKEEKDVVVILHDDRARAMLIWFLFLHGADLEETYQVSDIETWYLIEAADKYDLDIKLLQPWFVRWYEQTPPHNLRSEKFFYPYWIFDHAQGFQRATKYLVYNAKRCVIEFKPHPGYHLRVRPLIVQQLNGAKGRLTTILEQCLDETIEHLAQAVCPCSDKTNSDFLKELIRLHIFPFRSIFRRNHSVNEILERFQDFDYEPDSSACSECRRPSGPRRNRSNIHMGTLT